MLVKPVITASCKNSDCNFSEVVTCECVSNIGDTSTYHTKIDYKTLPKGTKTVIPTLSGTSPNRYVTFTCFANVDGLLVEQSKTVPVSADVIVTIVPEVEGDTKTADTVFKTYELGFYNNGGYNALQEDSATVTQKSYMSGSPVVVQAPGRIVRSDTTMYFDGWYLCTNNTPNASTDRRLSSNQMYTFYPIVNKTVYPHYVASSSSKSNKAEIAFTIQRGSYNNRLPTGGTSDWTLTRSKLDGREQYKRERLIYEMHYYDINWSVPIIYSQKNLNSNIESVKVIRAYTDNNDMTLEHMLDSDYLKENNVYYKVKTINAGSNGLDGRYKFSITSSRGMCHKYLNVVVAITYIINGERKCVYSDLISIDPSAKLKSDGTDNTEYIRSFNHDNVYSGYTYSSDNINVNIDKIPSDTNSSDSDYNS